VVAETAAAVVPPTAMLLIVPPVNVAPELASVFNVAVELAVSVVKAPAAAVDVPTGPLNESPAAPVWKSLSWAINSRIASLMPLGAHPSAMLIPSMSVLLAGVDENSEIFTFGMINPSVQ
jgi:hypothetical protein